MKKILSLVFVVGLLFTFERAAALDLYAFGSYWEKEDTDGSWGGGVGVAVPLFTDYVRLDGRAYYFENSNVGNNDELELVPLDLGLQIHILPDSRVDPYLLGGASYVYADSDRVDVDSEVGAYAGVGLDVKLFSVVKIFAEAMYRQTELSDEWSREDIDVSGVSGNLGLKFTF